MPIADKKLANAYGRAWWKANREAMTKAKADRRREQREFIVAAKSRPCVDCGVPYPPWVMEFDHVRGEKKYNVSHLARQTVSWKTIQEEIAKCDVVCRNCHAQRTHDRSVGDQAMAAGGFPSPVSSRFDSDGPR